MTFTSFILIVVVLFFNFATGMASHSINKLSLLSARKQVLNCSAQPDIFICEQFFFNKALASPCCMQTQQRAN